MKNEPRKRSSPLCYHFGAPADTAQAIANNDSGGTDGSQKHADILGSDYREMSDRLDKMLANIKKTV